MPCVGMWRWCKLSLMKTSRPLPAIKQINQLRHSLTQNHPNNPKRSQHDATLSYHQDMRRICSETAETKTVSFRHVWVSVVDYSYVFRFPL